MGKIKHWNILTVLFKVFLGISGSTHWVVTENGKIQSQLDSAFHMRRPYDLLSLLEQEKRADDIERLYREMVSRKASIDKEWAGLESATELEARLYSSDKNCVTAGRPLSDIDLYISLADDGSGREDIRMEELIPTEIPDDTPSHPDCAALLHLDFSMSTLPHLQVLSWNLTIAPEHIGLKSLSDITARQIAAALQRNHTSWYAHNMAAVYWRTQGDARRALQCAKRAVYLSPSEYRDIALLNLGCIVQQARYLAEAVILLHAASDHQPYATAPHLALANTYALLGDYNRSVACYDNALKLLPMWAVPLQNRLAVLCHHNLENSLYQLHRSLQGILSQLHNYHKLQEQWLKHQEQLMFQQAPLEVKLQGFQHEPLTALLSHRAGDKCIPETKDGTTVLNCDSKLLAHHLQIDITLSLQMLLKNVEAQAQKISAQMSRRLTRFSESEPPSPEESQAEPEADMDEAEGALEIFVEAEYEEKQRKSVIGEASRRTSSHFLPYKHPKLRSLKEIGVQVMDFIEELMKSQKLDENMLMPEHQCKTSSFNTDGCSDDNSHWMVPATLDKETRQSKVLPIAQTLGIVEEGSWLQNTSSHVLATLIITCIQLTQWDMSEIPFTKEQPQCAGAPGSLAELTADSFHPVRPEPRLKPLFHSLLLEDGVTLADFTSHLTHALKDKSRHAPSSAWLLETAAALYWRCVGDTRQMVTCLQAAVHKAPPDLKDIPLHHVAHILLTLGHSQDALVLASLALKVAPRSINAHMVLFHTYVALGESENAVKYSKASMALYQQTQGSASP